MNRVQWMGGSGKQLFGEWTTTLLQEADTPDFWQSYEDALVKSYPGVVTPGVVLGPDQVVTHLTSETVGALTRVDKQMGISRDILLPHEEEIMRFTGSADRMTRNNLPSPDALMMNARDSLRFAIGFSAGLANDVFLQHTAPFRRLVERSYHTFETGSMAEKAAAYKDIVRVAGDWWDESLQPASLRFEDPQPDGMYGLHRLAFTTRALGNVSFISQLEAMTAGGFDAIGDRASFPIEHHLGQIGARPNVGWVNRALRFQVERPESVPYGPYALLEYDKPVDTFHCRPEALAYLHRSLREQNQSGLSKKSFDTAGNLATLEPKRPFSRGCPVARMGVIASTTSFTAKAYEVAAAMHVSYWE